MFQTLRILNNCYKKFKLPRPMQGGSGISVAGELGFFVVFQGETRNQADKVTGEEAK